MCLYGVVEEEKRSVLRNIALQSFLDCPNGVLVSQKGFGCSWFPLNGRGILVFSFSLSSLFPVAPVVHN